MSSILDALEKAEGERIRGTKPGLGSTRRRPAGRRFSLPVMAGAIVGLLLINLTIWWFYLRTAPVDPAPSSSTSLEPAAPVTPTQSPAPVQPSTPAPTPKPALSLREQLKRNAAPSAKPLIDEAQVAQKPAPPPPPVPVESPVAAEKQVLKTTSEPVRSEVAVATPSAEAVSRAASVPATAALPPPKPIVETVPPPAPSPVEPPPEEQIPLVWELPQSLREKVLQLKSSVHVYNKTPALRFVIINMHRYSEGDTLPPDGFRLARIDRDGVVIDYGEGQVRLPRR
jgi:hypothetical protein